MRKRARTAVTKPFSTVLTPVTTAPTMLPRPSCARETAESKALSIWASPMFNGGPAAHSRTFWTPSTTPSVNWPDWDATGTAISATIPAATSRNSTVTVDAARAGFHPRRSRKRVGGQVSVVRSRPITSGHTTDHIRPSNHRLTAIISNMSSNSAEARADVRSAARVLVELKFAVTEAPYGYSCHTGTMAASAVGRGIARRPRALRRSGQGMPAVGRPSGPSEQIWEDSDGCADTEGRAGGWMFLGHGGTDPPASGRHGDPGGIHRR